MKKLGLFISMVFCFAMCSFGQTDNTVEQDAGIVFDLSYRFKDFFLLNDFLLFFQFFLNQADQ